MLSNMKLQHSIAVVLKQGSFIFFLPVRKDYMGTSKAREIQRTSEKIHYEVLLTPYSAQGPPA
jgi:hypothetical protein